MTYLLKLHWHFLAVYCLSLVALFCLSLAGWRLRGIIFYKELKNSKIEAPVVAVLMRAASRIRKPIENMLEMYVSLPMCAVLVVCAFMLGMGATDYYREKTRNTFKFGYQARDIEAYSNFVQRPNIEWHILGVYLEPHYNKTAYTLETKSGQIVKNFMPCEEMGWYEGQVLTEASYYKRDGCMSFVGPSAHWTIEPYEQAKGQIR